MNSAKPPSIRWERCPYLGLHDDSSTSLGYASPWNYCYRATPAASILVSYQVEVCLCPNFAACKVYHSNQWGRLPPGLRGKDRAGRLRNHLPGKVIQWAGLILLLLAVMLLILFPQQLLP